MRPITFFIFTFGSHLLVFQLSPSDMLLVFRCELDAIGVRLPWIISEVNCTTFFLPGV
jgi:hypothetical protein